jgi:hypothetical protein
MWFKPKREKYLSIEMKVKAQEEEKRKEKCTHNFPSSFWSPKKPREENLWSKTVPVKTSRRNKKKLSDKFFETKGTRQR